jgi:hypothetical protein
MGFQMIILRQENQITLRFTQIHGGFIYVTKRRQQLGIYSVNWLDESE